MFKDGVIPHVSFVLVSYYSWSNIGCRFYYNYNVPTEQRRAYDQNIISVLYYFMYILKLVVYNN